MLSCNLSDLLKTCENELLKNDNLFSDETLLSELEKPIAMDGDTFDFLNISNADEFKDIKGLKDPTILKPANTNVMLTQTTTANNQPVTCVQQDVIGSVQNRPQRISVASTPTVFSSQYAIPQNVNFNVQSPVVTLAPVSQQRQLLLPAKLIKSESVVYPRGAQAITSTPVPHQIHTLVNTANGTVLTTGKRGHLNFIIISKRCVMNNYYEMVIREI